MLQGRQAMGVESWEGGGMSVCIVWWSGGWGREGRAKQGRGVELEVACRGRGAYGDGGKKQRKQPLVPTSRTTWVTSAMPEV